MTFLFSLYLCNRSVFKGYVIPSQKPAIVFPTLKKSNLDPTFCQSYRPISNLSILSKTLERFVSHQLLSYLEISGLLPTHQSGFRANHSTETVFLALLFTQKLRNHNSLSLPSLMVRLHLIW